MDRVDGETHPSDPTTSGVIERISAMRSAMPEAQRSLAEFVLGSPAAVASMTILELAERCAVSTGTITRFCRALGLNGYAPLRIALAADSGRTGRGTWAAHIGVDVAEGDDIRQMANVVAANIGHVVAEAIANLELTDVDRAATTLAAARRVVVYGVGGSAAAALEFQQRLYCIGMPAWTYTDVHVASAGVALMGRGDALVVISHSGRTREVCDLAAQAGSRGLTTIAITNDPASPVAYRATLTLATQVRAVGITTEAVLARHAQLAVLDLLYVAIAHRTFDQARAAIAATAHAVQPYKPDHR
jgi:DNA-binding MurR/RpiR family transcriptional regulator